MSTVVVLYVFPFAGDHARVSDIVSEVERRDLRAATARLHQATEGHSSSSSSSGNGSGSETLLMETEQDLDIPQQQQDGSI